MRNLVLASVAYLALMAAPALAQQQHNFDKDAWLKARFGQQHQQLIPIVAVADMYFSCQREQAIKPELTVKQLITELDRNELAECLTTCLGEHSPKSDVALNYGLKACFYEQLSGLEQQEKQQKMALVVKAIASLSREERQKSFTKCVTDQAIGYLK